MIEVDSSGTAQLAGKRLSHDHAEAVRKRLVPDTEWLLQPSTHEVRVFSNHDPNARAQLDAFLDIRERYILDRAWNNGGVEVDPYDINPDTVSFTLYEHQTNEETDPKLPYLGMRLTPVRALEDSLSWSMLADTPELQTAIQADHSERFEIAAQKGALFDLTRFVVDLDSDFSFDKTSGGLAELVAVASQHFHTKGAALEDMQWFFITTPTIYEMMTQMDIDTEVLGSGRAKNSDGTYEEVIACVSEPFKTFEYVEQQIAAGHKLSRTNLPRWYEASGALQRTSFSAKLGSTALENVA